jgi:hypothetical protein
MKHTKLFIFGFLFASLCVFGVKVDTTHAATFVVNGQSIIINDTPTIVDYGPPVIGHIIADCPTAAAGEFNMGSVEGGFWGWPNTYCAAGNANLGVPVCSWGGYYRTDKTPPFYLEFDSGGYDPSDPNKLEVCCNGFGGFASCAPPAPNIALSAPTNNATITANTTNLTGTYSGFYQDDFGAYQPIKIWLQNPNNGLQSTTYTIALTSGSGNFSTPLSTFGITENGEWDLYATQTIFSGGSNIILNLTPSPKYDLIFNVAGNSAPYNFTDWGTWYSANAAGGYSVPSDFGNAIEGFFQPIFTNVFEFYNNTSQYFNATTAHDKGFLVGQIFPTAQAYLDNIDIFFGGFPLVAFFEFAIIVMLGIFIVRTIFKFIPFFG